MPHQLAGPTTFMLPDFPHTLAWDDTIGNYRWPWPQHALTTDVNPDLATMAAIAMRVRDDQLPWLMPIVENVMSGWNLDWWWEPVGRSDPDYRWQLTVNHPPVELMVRLQAVTSAAPQVPVDQATSTPTTTHSPAGRDLPDPIDEGDRLQNWIEHADDTTVTETSADRTEPGEVLPEGRSIEEIRARVEQIPAGLIDDAVLHSVGLTESDYERWKRDFDEQEAAAHEREQAEVDATVEAYAAELSPGQARRIIERAEETQRHTHGCNLDVAHCEICGPLENDGDPDEISLRAAYRRLAAESNPVLPDPASPTA